MNHSFWRLASRKDAADILCGKSINTLMQNGPYGYGLYLQPVPTIPDVNQVRLQFEFEEFENYSEKGWSAVSDIPPPDADVLYGNTVVGDDGNQIVCVFDSKKVRLVSIAC